ncbi:hypothetical protein [Paludisphaera soli]|uniref:hypothetical protein n=1 Tax=Paludisphaera soli TaxID=2712865 RepID=UPI0013ED4492|nr:hypothetical protein [Paludisphaera soli]
MYGWFMPRRDETPEGTPPRPTPKNRRRGRSAKRPRRRGEAREPERSWLRPWEVDALLAALIARPRAARAAARELDPAYFSREPFHRVVWECLLQSFSHYEPGEVPYDVLRAAVASRLAAWPVAIDPTDRAALLAEPGDVGRPIVAGRPNPVVRSPGLLFRAYEEAKRLDPSPREGLEELKLFLLERGVRDELARLVARGGADSIPGDFFPAFRAILDRKDRLAWLDLPPRYRFDRFPDDR